LPLVYTYVVLEGGVLRFCEATSVVSHAGMSGAPETLWGAGEFWVQHQRGRYWLCVTNDSGTYAPTLDCLEMVATLFRDIVGEDFEVEAIEQNDPRVKEYWRKGGLRGDPKHNTPIHSPVEAQATKAKMATTGSSQSPQVKVIYRTSDSLSRTLPATGPTCEPLVRTSAKVADFPAHPLARSPMASSPMQALSRVSLCPAAIAVQSQTPHIVGHRRVHSWPGVQIASVQCPPR